MTGDTVGLLAIHFRKPRCVILYIQHGHTSFVSNDTEKASVFWDTNSIKSIIYLSCHLLDITSHGTKAPRELVFV